MISSPHNLTPVGYLILLTADAARDADEYGRRFGLYCGVDRLPPIYRPDDELRRQLNIPLVHDVKQKKLLEDYFAARAQFHAFIGNGTLAANLRDGLEELGYSLELVFCELAWQPGEEDRCTTYSPPPRRPAKTKITYGFDVSWPTCNHSAILQPGIVPEDTAWQKRLNQYGLLDTFDDAEQLRRAYLKFYPVPPFDIFLVHSI